MVALLFLRDVDLYLVLLQVVDLQSQLVIHILHRQVLRLQLVD